MPKRCLAAYQFWEWVAFLCLPAAVACLIWVNWWVAVGLVILWQVIHKANTKTTPSFVLGHSLENAAFYQFALENDIIRVEKVLPNG